MSTNKIVIRKKLSVHICTDKIVGTTANFYRHKHFIGTDCLGTMAQIEGPKSVQSAHPKHPHPLSPAPTLSDFSRAKMGQQGEALF